MQQSLQKCLSLIEVMNRIGSLAQAFEDLDELPGDQLLTHVREVVREIVAGDFDHVDLHVQRVSAMEQLVAQQNRPEPLGMPCSTDSFHAEDDSGLRIQQRYAQQLQWALRPFEMPEYLREFVTQVWSQALVMSQQLTGPDSELAQRMRQTGREVIVSAMPKGLPGLRRSFLMQLPELIKNLKEGMRLIEWPELAQDSFWAQLLPTQADSLDLVPMAAFDRHLLSRQLDAVFCADIQGLGPASDSDIQHFDPAPTIWTSIFASPSPN